MKKFAFILSVLAALLLLSFVQAQAQAVGRLTQVEGRVDLLKGGNLPATPVKVDDTVAPKDIIRTKSLSKAQVTFIDNSVITISPESRIAIEEYAIEPSQGKRRAVLELFQGLALAVVNKIYKVEEPDFIIKTHTAIMGIRGTEIGVRIQPNSSMIMNFQGQTQVGNIFPEISQLFLKAFKVAYSFGPWNDKSNRWVLLKDMQATTVTRDLPPTLPYTISSQDRDMFMRQLSAGSTQASKLGQGLDRVRGTSLPTSPVSFMNPGEQTTLAMLNTVTVPPVVVPQTQSQSQTQITTPTVTVAGVAIPVFNILASWGPGATDLDLHLSQPANGSTFHVYYYNQGNTSTLPYAKLNGDSQAVSGSEVITVQQYNQGGLYQALVFCYPDRFSTTSTTLSSLAGASLQVINGGTVVPQGSGSTVNGGTVVTSITPPTGLVGNTWVAVTIDPANGQVTTVNQITNTNNGVPITTVPATTAAAANITAIPPAASATAGTPNPTTPAIATAAAAPNSIPPATSTVAAAPTTPVPPR